MLFFISNFDGGIPRVSVYVSDYANVELQNGFFSAQRLLYYLKRTKIETNTYYSLGLLQKTMTISNADQQWRRSTSPNDVPRYFLPVIAFCDVLILLAKGNTKAVVASI